MGNGLQMLKNYVEFEYPKGGFYYWLRLKDNISAKNLYSKCLEKNLLIVPGDMFFAIKKRDQFYKIKFCLL